MRKLLNSINDVVESTGISRPTIYRAIKAKELAALKRGRRTYIETAELDRWKSSWTRIGREPAAA